MSSSGASTPRSVKETTHYLEGLTLLKAVISLNAANGISFIDLLGITAILPAISNEYSASGTIAWAATSQLIGSTIGQCILGYLSDLYSRRRMLQVATLILTFSSLACSLSSYTRSAAFLYAIRAVAGIGTGSISNLVNIAQNDFLPVHRRGKYQGIQGLSVAIGSIIGVMAGAALADVTHGWRILYYIETALAFLSFISICLFVPANISPPRKGEVRNSLKNFDTFGILSGAAATIPLLILMCQASTLQHNLPVLIALAVISPVCFAIFIYLGFKSNRSVRPVIPFLLFRNRTIAAILAQNVLFGAVYYSFTYFVPLYLQVVRQLSPVKSSTLFIPYFVTHGFWSTMSGLILSYLQNRGRKSYSYILAGGFCIWTLAMGLLAWSSDRSTNMTIGHHSTNISLGLFVLCEVLVGLGTGSVFQNSIMAIRAQVTSEHNAVAVSTRNVLRFFGGALGIAIASTVLEQRLKYTMPWRLEWVSDSAFSRPPADLTPEDRLLVQNAYAHAIAYVWYIATGMIALCVALTLLIRDTRLQTNVGKGAGGSSSQNDSSQEDLVELERGQREEPVAK